MVLLITKAGTAEAMTLGYGDEQWRVAVRFPIQLVSTPDRLWGLPRYPTGAPGINPPKKATDGSQR